MDFGDCAKQLTGGEGDGSNVGAICLARLTFGSLDSRVQTIAKSRALQMAARERVSSAVCPIGNRGWALVPLPEFAKSGPQIAADDAAALGMEITRYSRLMKRRYPSYGTSLESTLE